MNTHQEVFQGESSCDHHILNNFSVLYFNARSLLPKIDELRLVCAVTRPDVVCVVESWLNDDIDDSELVSSDFYIIRLDRNRHGGGIVFFIKSYLYSEVLLKSPFRGRSYRSLLMWYIVTVIGGD